ncbi:hypothetical protein G7046_g5006 [Stylonectria norvegica]|nr:hypothetical protein G7046_g5006 [Stylonectria norvegica]
MTTVPGTPRKKRPAAHEELNRKIRSINDDFRLHLRVPDPTLSPSRRKQQVRSEEQERVDAIYNRAQYLHFKHPTQLSIRIGRFRNQAEELLRQWVNKPNADPDTTPTRTRSSAPLRNRSSPEERTALQKLLLELLVQDIDSTRSRWPKRRSDEFPDPNAKRSKASDSRADSVDDIPVRTKTATPPERPEDSGVRGASNYSFQSRSFTTHRSANSSKLSLAPTVFSVAVEDNFPNSQTTIDNDSFRKGTQDSYPACTQEYQALNESFSIYDAEPVASQSDVQEPPGKEPELPEPLATQPFLIRRYDDTLADLPVLGSEGTAYSSIPEMADMVIPYGDSSSLERCLTSGTLAERLKNIWPKFPSGFSQAPLIIIWELTRAAIHCGVDLQYWDLDYTPGDAWHDQTRFRGQVVGHRLFVGKGLPPSCDTTTWKGGLGFFCVNEKAVTLSAELSFSPEEDGPLFKLKLESPKLELGHRLGRRFGADRFLEVTIPSPTGRDVPSIVKYDDQGPAKLIKWLTDRPHYFLGRTWVPFYVRRATKKVKDPHPPHKTRTIPLERVYFFALDGNSFRPGSPRSPIPPLDDTSRPLVRIKMRRCDLLNWALNIEHNAKQPVPKLFTRLALSLSRTIPTITLENHQIRHRASDLGDVKVMNDGIGLMSRSFARKVATNMGLSETPCSFQARFGSAKGIWLIDVNDDGLADNDWIETYPSQRKWICDFKDVHHRTFEVRNWSRELRPAALNQQFIPVLEAQAHNPERMRTAIAGHLEAGLRMELDGQVTAMKHPMDLRAWMQRAGFSSSDRKSRGYIPFLAGLPDRDEEIIPYLLDAGFDAMKNEYLCDLTWIMRKRQTDQLKAKMNIKIPRSTYAYMVIDFTGTLEEGEVQLAFSSKFQADGDSETLLDGIDVLVARAPAHFVSDIQKVKAVFRPNLKLLKDVIVFSSKGDSPLADLLSGGDYDGDQAWVCWDPEIVNNFHSAPLPQNPDLIRQGYIRLSNPTFQSILDASLGIDKACAEFLHQALSFSMQPSLLGICTSFKEKLCYFENRVDSERAVALSTLVGLLVDQSKQGLLFTRDDFSRLKQDMEMQSKEPEYDNEKSSRYRNRDGSVHVLDFLKFDVANVCIETALKEFSQAIRVSSVQKWDKDLAGLFDEFEAYGKGSRSYNKIMTELRTDLKTLEAKWKTTMANQSEDRDFSAKVNEIYDEWLQISPPKELLRSKSIGVLLDSWNGDPNLSKWSLLKASTMFKICYSTGYPIVWRIAGRQLAWIKAVRSLGNTGAVAVTGEMWSVLRPDAKCITSLAAQRGVGKDNESVAAIEAVTDFDDFGAQIDDS